MKQSYYSSQLHWDIFKSTFGSITINDKQFFWNVVNITKGTNVVILVVTYISQDVWSLMNILSLFPKAWQISLSFNEHYFLLFLSLFNNTQTNVFYRIIIILNSYLPLSHLQIQVILQNFHLQTIVIILNYHKKLHHIIVSFLEQQELIPTADLDISEPLSAIFSPPDIHLFVELASLSSLTHAYSPTRKISSTF